MTDPTNVTGISPKFDPKLASEIETELQGTKKRHPAKGSETTQETLERVPTGPRPTEPTPAKEKNPKRVAAAEKTQARLREEREAEEAKRQTAQQKRAEQFELQESKRATRYMPDIQPVLWVAITIATLNILTAGLVSYFTLTDVAGWMMLPVPWLDYVVPGFIELFILFSSIDYVVSESRVKRSGRLPFWVMVGTTGIAVVSQAAHALEAWLETGQVPWFGWFGVALSAVAPLVIVYISKRLTALVFTEPIEEEK